MLLLEDTSCNVRAGKYSYSSLSYIKVKNMNISILLNYLDGWFDLNIYIVTDSLEGLHKQYTSRVVYGNLNILYGRKMK